MPRSEIIKRIFYSLLAGFAIAILINEFSYALLKTKQDRAPKEIVLEIPAGTAARVARGESDPSIPSDMTLVKGDTLTVENHDSVSHQLGPFFIPPGSSSSIHLDTAGSLQYTCTFQAQNYLGLDVLPPLTLATRLAGIVLSAIPMTALFALYGLIAIPYKKPSEKSV